MLLSGNLTLLWKMTIFSGKIHYKWPFSIAMLNYQGKGMPVLGKKIQIQFTRKKTGEGV
jgi:hypothetical protein